MSLSSGTVFPCDGRCYWCKCKRTLTGAYHSECLCMDSVFRRDMKIPLTVLQTLLLPPL